ncbi:MAG: hypothetical protein R3C97_13980 [Geminicoccaceae bacterium]
MAWNDIKERPATRPSAIFDQLSSRGYLTTAFGSRKFFEMAVNLALSVRLNDPDRPVCLVHNASEEVPDDIARAFDSLTTFPDGAETVYAGTALKLLIDQVTPYRETFFVDSDCMILKKDMDRHWQKFGQSDFMICGEKRTRGHISSLDVQTMMKVANVDHIVDMNSGVIFLRSSPASTRLFETARELYRTRRETFTEIRARRGDGIGDQPFFGAAMAACGIDPISYEPGEGSLMVTTYRARNVDFDLDEPRSFLEKPTGFRMLNRFWAKSWVRHDTTIGHFVAGKPKRVYQTMSDRLRTIFNWPLYDFGS